MNKIENDISDKEQDEKYSKIQESKSNEHNSELKKFDVKCREELNLLDNNNNRLRSLESNEMSYLFFQYQNNMSRNYLYFNLNMLQGYYNDLTYRQNIIDLNLPYNNSINLVNNNNINIPNNNINLINNNNINLPNDNNINFRKKGGNIMINPEKK